jgi:hypothetical protein
MKSDVIVVLSAIASTVLARPTKGASPTAIENAEGALEGAMQGPITYTEHFFQQRRAREGVPDHNPVGFFTEV